MAIINLISGPRNISTALMYSFAQRKDTKVRDEPFYGNYLRRFPEVNHPGQEETIAFMENDLEKIKKELQEQHQEKPVLFIKNMAHHLIAIDVDFILDYQNVFLIRNPKQLIASFAQVMPNPTMQDIGMQRQAALFDFILDKTGQAPPVLDSGEVLKNPEKVLSALCQQLNLDFDPHMLHWEAGQRHDPAPWNKYWYANVWKSTGFAKQSTSSRPLPVHCVPLYEQALPIYEKLIQYSIKA